MTTYEAVQEKLAPQNMDAEAALLGSLLIDPDALMVIRHIVTSEMFYREAHRCIFQAMLDLARDGAPADLITLTDELSRRGRLEEIGGLSYVSSLANHVPTSANAEYYAEIVRRTWVHRELIRYAGQVAAVAYNDPEADVALAQAEKMLRRISAGLGNSDVVEADTAMDRWYARVTANMDARTMPGVRTGFKLLDSHIVGLMPAEVATTVGRPGMSKSAWLLELAKRLLAAGKSVLYVSLEMPEDQLINRLLASMSGVDTRAFRSNFVLPDQQVDTESFEKVMRVFDPARELLRGKLRWRTIPTNDEKLRGMTLRLVERGQCDVVLVDYLGLLKTAERRTSVYERISDLAKALKDLALEARIPVVTLAQLSRKPEGREDPRPQLADLRDSGVIEEASDFVFGLYRPAYYDNARADKHDEERFRSYAELIVLKARDGVAHARLPLCYTPHSTTYEDWPTFWGIPDKI
jgi:replicative DNA helicase